MRGTNAEQKWLAGEAEAVHRCLDELNVPRAFNNEELSLWGRVVRWKNSDDESMNVEPDNGSRVSNYDYVSAGLIDPDTLS